MIKPLPDEVDPDADFYAKVMEPEFVEKYNELADTQSPEMDALFGVVQAMPTNMELRSAVKVVDYSNGAQIVLGLYFDGKPVAQFDTTILSDDSFCETVQKLSQLKAQSSLLESAADIPVSSVEDAIEKVSRFFGIGDEE